MPKRKLLLSMPGPFSFVVPSLKLRHCARGGCEVTCGQDEGWGTRNERNGWRRCVLSGMCLKTAKTKRDNLLTDEKEYPKIGAAQAIDGRLT